MKNPSDTQTELQDIMDEYAEASRKVMMSIFSWSPMFTERMDEAVAKAHSHVTQAKIDELYAANVDRNDPETFNKRIAKLKKELK